MDTEGEDTPQTTETIVSAPPAAAVLAVEKDDTGPPTEEVLYPHDQPKPDEAEPAKEEIYQLHMPEGVRLDRPMLEAAMPVFRDAGISRDQAQKLIPLVPQIQERIYDQQEDEFAVVRAGWTKATKQDREIGGEHLGETKRLVSVALKAGGAASLTHEMRKLMTQSGLGDHPSVLRVFRKLGQVIEGYQRKEALANRQPRRGAEALYPDDYRS